MTDFFGRSSSSSPKQGNSLISLKNSGNAERRVDLAAQKEAVVNAIRAEINLATAQELISVRTFCDPICRMFHSCDSENVGEMFCKMRHKARDVIDEFGGGESWCVNVLVVMPHRITFFRRV